MNHINDAYFYWISSTFFGDVRLQHHNNIIEAVDDGRFRWAIKKNVSEVIDWINNHETPKPLTEDQKRQMLWEEEKKKIAAILDRERRRMEKRYEDKTDKEEKLW